MEQMSKHLSAQNFSLVAPLSMCQPRHPFSDLSVKSVNPVLQRHGDMQILGFYRSAHTMRIEHLSYLAYHKVGVGKLRIRSFGSMVDSDNMNKMSVSRDTIFQIGVAPWGIIRPGIAAGVHLHLAGQ